MNHILPFVRVPGGLQGLDGDFTGAFFGQLPDPGTPNRRAFSLDIDGAGCTACPETAGLQTSI